MIKTYKAVLRVPTSEQYAYIEVSLEDTPESLYEAYKTFTGLVRGESGSGLPQKDFNASLDEFLLTNSLKDGAERYGKMSPAQQTVLQEVKKALKRIKSKDENVIEE